LGLVLLAAWFTGCEKSLDDENSLAVYVSGRLAPGFGLGLNTSHGRTDWLHDFYGYMRAAYPAGQAWGAVLITNGGDPVQPPRPGRDCTDYGYLSVDIRGEHGDETVEIGIKDNTDPDDGSEDKIKITDISTDWQTLRFNLEEFETADLSRLYVVFEIVFEGTKGQTVYFRNVRLQRK
jgi:hypothetical protein